MMPRRSACLLSLTLLAAAPLQAQETQSAPTEAMAQMDAEFRLVIDSLRREQLVRLTPASMGQTIAFLQRQHASSDDAKSLLSDLDADRGKFSDEYRQRLDSMARVAEDWAREAGFASFAEAKAHQTAAVAGYLHLRMREESQDLPALVDSLETEFNAVFTRPKPTADGNSADADAEAAGQLLAAMLVKSMLVGMRMVAVLVEKGADNAAVVAPFRAQLDPYFAERSGQTDTMAERLRGLLDKLKQERTGNER